MKTLGKILLLTFVVAAIVITIPLLASNTGILSTSGHFTVDGVKLQTNALKTFISNKLTISHTSGIEDAEVTINPINSISYIEDEQYNNWVNCDLDDVFEVNTTENDIEIFKTKTMLQKIGDVQILSEFDILEIPYSQINIKVNNDILYILVLEVHADASIALDESWVF